MTTNTPQDFALVALRAVDRRGFLAYYGPMKDLSVTQLKATLARRLREVQGGEQIVITEHKRPVARLVAIADDELVQQRPTSAFAPETARAAPRFRGSVTDLLAAERGGH